MWCSRWFDDTSLWPLQFKNYRSEDGRGKAIDVGGGVVELNES